MERLTVRAAQRWCVFFDRDGTLNAHVVRAGLRTSPRHPSEWVTLPGVTECFAQLRAAGALLAIVTNQPDLERGLIGWAQLDRLHRRLPPLDGLYVCPHTARHRCQCRKPSSALLRKAGCDLSVSLADSYFIGDRPTDAQAALNAGCTAVLLSQAAVQEDCRLPGLHYAPSLPDAATVVLRHRRHAYSKRHTDHDHQ